MGVFELIVTSEQWEVLQKEQKLTKDHHLLALFRYDLIKESPILICFLTLASRCTKLCCNESYYKKKTANLHRRRVLCQSVIKHTHTKMYYVSDLILGKCPSFQTKKR